MAGGVIAPVVDGLGYSGSPFAQEWQQPSSTPAQPGNDLQVVGQLEPVANTADLNVAAGACKTPGQPASAPLEHAAGAAAGGAAATSSRLAAAGGNRPEAAAKHAGMFNPNPPKRPSTAEQLQQRKGSMPSGSQPHSNQQLVPLGHHSDDFRIKHKLSGGSAHQPADAAVAGTSRQGSDAAKKVLLPPPPPSHWQRLPGKVHGASTHTAAGGAAGGGDKPTAATAGSERPQQAAAAVAQGAGQGTGHDGHHNADTEHAVPGNSSAAARKGTDKHKARSGRGLDASGKRKHSKTPHHDDSGSDKEPDGEASGEEGEGDDEATMRLIAELQTQDGHRGRTRRAAAQKATENIKMCTDALNHPGHTVAVQLDKNFKVEKSFCRPIMPPGKKGTHDEELMFPNLVAGGKPRVMPPSGRARSPRRRTADSRNNSKSTNSNSNTHSNNGGRPAAASPNSSTVIQQSRSPSLQRPLQQEQIKPDEKKEEKKTGDGQKAQPAPGTSPHQPGDGHKAAGDEPAQQPARKRTKLACPDLVPMASEDVPVSNSQSGEVPHLQISAGAGQAATHISAALQTGGITGQPGEQPPDLHADHEHMVDHMAHGDAHDEHMADQLAPAAQHTGPRVDSSPAPARSGAQMAASGSAPGAQPPLGVWQQQQSHSPPSQQQPAQAQPPPGAATQARQEKKHSWKSRPPKVRPHPPDAQQQQQAGSQLQQTLAQSQPQQGTSQPQQSAQQLPRQPAGMPPHTQASSYQQPAPQPREGQVHPTPQQDATPFAAVPGAFTSSGNFGSLALPSNALGLHQQPSQGGATHTPQNVGSQQLPGQLQTAASGHSRPGSHPTHNHNSDSAQAPPPPPAPFAPGSTQYGQGAAYGQVPYNPQALYAHHPQYQTQQPYQQHQPYPYPHQHQQYQPYPPPAHHTTHPSGHLYPQAGHPVTQTGPQHGQYAPSGTAGHHPNVSTPAHSHVYAPGQTGSVQYNPNPAYTTQHGTAAQHTTPHNQYPSAAHLPAQVPGMQPSNSQSHVHAAGSAPPASPAPVIAVGATTHHAASGSAPPGPSAQPPSPSPPPLSTQAAATRAPQLVHVKPEPLAGLQPGIVSAPSGTQGTSSTSEGVAAELSAVDSKLRDTLYTGLWGKVRELRRQVSSVADDGDVQLPPMSAMFKQLHMLRNATISQVQLALTTIGLVEDEMAKVAGMAEAERTERLKEVARALRDALQQLASQP